MISPKAEKTTCQECGMLCEAGAAEYHPYEFCRARKAGWKGPWRTVPAQTIHTIGPGLKLAIEDGLRKFWRDYYKTEVTLP